MDSQHSVSDALKRTLADTYALYLKTQTYHWNVEGPHFVSFHALFETHYKELAEAIDAIAELIRSLNEKAPGSFRAYQDLTIMEPAREDAPALTMIEDLLTDHEAMFNRLEQSLAVATACKEDVTADFLIERMRCHRKNAWMLRAILHAPHE